MYAFVVDNRLCLFPYFALAKRALEIIQQDAAEIISICLNNQEQCMHKMGENE